MKCPNCSFDNRDDAAFCENCGEVFVSSGARTINVPPVVEVPPVVKVPDIASKPQPSAPRASVADLVDPIPDGPDVPDLSGFERLVDSSYVPPATAQAGDTAEIPRINDEYVPRARNYAMGLTEKELRRRDRQQQKLAKKFSKMQEKEEARKAKELMKAEKERLRAETAAEKERIRAAEAEAREQRRAAEAAERERLAALEREEQERLAALEREEQERREEERAAQLTVEGAHVKAPEPETDLILDASETTPVEEPTAEAELIEAASAIVVADQAALTQREAEPVTGEIDLTFDDAPEQAFEDGDGAPDAFDADKAAFTEEPGAFDALTEDAPLGELKPARSKAPLIAALCIACAVVLLMVAGGTYLAEMWGGKSVPEVVGLSQLEAADALAAKGFTVEVAEEKSDEPQGTVLGSDPEQGKRAEEGSTVTLTVATPRTVPAIVGLSQTEAADALTGEGLAAVTYAEQKSNEPAGTVLAVSPEAGTEVKSADAITVTVAVPYTVPSVEGLSEGDAKAALEAEGYNVDTEWYTTEDIEEGTAVSTDPAAGTELNSGSDVVLYIAHSRGTELVELTREILPGANLKTDEGSFKVENIKNCAYRGEGEVLYTVEARQYEVVTMPFGLGQETVFSKTLTTIEGGIVWNDDNEVSYASPSIRY
ncbi:PASTA domain-containing protein [Adlercreutzia sp. R25]|uniref:PASTA domain-containing protein n=1 Tax=Adlercreutzia shanghongiae TaxID=3111773 RepID=UPI002DB8813B|nr:PASTA domain-containing protein [Adlercreutzia sp. R25]MEC4272403.1 PASTA domain-containing protein [Adlercreutzia sp. R25]